MPDWNSIAPLGANFAQKPDLAEMNILSVISKLGVLFLIALSALHLSAQQGPEKAPEFSSANIFGSVGFIPLYGTLNGNLEILLTKSPRAESLFPHCYVRLGAGRWASWGAKGPLGIAGATFLRGTGNNHLETFIGATLLKDDYYDNEVQLFPAAFIGYRYQPPVAGGIFRAGIGWPEAVSLSLGLSL